LKRKNKHTKTHQNQGEEMKSKKLALLSAAAGILWSLNASAQFNYDDNTDELLLGLRTSGGTSDLLVNIGSASVYANASGPITISGTYFTGSQLTASGLSLNNLTFSIFDGMFSGSPTNVSLWVTSPENPSGTLTTPWSAQNSAQLNTSRSHIQSIGDGGNFLGAVDPVDALTNSLYDIEMPDNYNQSGNTSYAVGIGPNGNFQGNFGSNNNIENTTGAAFTSGSTPAISDLYLMLPNQSGILIGQFELDPNGTLTFNPVAVPEPTTWAMFGMGILGLAGWRRILNRK
jgi:hypothetical protein